MSFTHCPGIKDLVGPTQIIIRSCPACGEEVEFFSDETETKCTGCGKALHREASPSCVIWCKYAEKCITDLEKRRLLSATKSEELKGIAKRGHEKRE